MAVKPVPDGYHTVTPYVIVRNVEGLIDFVQKAFDARDVQVFRQPDGLVMHAEVKIGDSPFMMAEANDKNPPMPGMLQLYVEDTDAVYKRALEAGAASMREPEDQFYGDRTGGVKDAFGNHWWISTHIEDVSKEEMERRMKAQGG